MQTVMTWLCKCNNLAIRGPHFVSVASVHWDLWGICSRTLWYDVFRPATNSTCWYDPLPTMYFVMFASSLSNSTAGDSEMKVKNWKIERYELNQLIQKRSEWVVDFTRRTKGRMRGTHPGRERGNKKKKWIKHCQGNKWWIKNMFLVMKGIKKINLRTEKK